MAKTSKATKRFQSKHLKHTIDHRRKVQKHNKLKGSSKKSTAPDGDEVKPEKKSTKPVFDDMSMEDFFESDMKLPTPKKGTKVSAGSEDKDEDEDEEQSEDIELDDSEEEAGAGAASDEEGESSEEEDEEQLKEEMDKLAEKDPEFYSYLQKNDKALLDFEGVNPMDAMSDDEDDEEEEGEEDEEPEKKQKTQKKKTDITKELLISWDKKLKTPTTKVVQNVVAAFKAGVNINISEEDNGRYTVSDPSVFADLMFIGLRSVPDAIQKLAPYKVNSKGIRSLDEKNENTNQIARILKSQAGAYITLLEDISNTETAALVLSSLQDVLPFYLSHRKILKQIYTAVVDVWATTQNLETQIAAYAFMNNSAREFPKAVLEIILKQTYSSFLKACRKTNIHTMDLINFAKNSASELFGINEQLSYQVGFEYVRQLAIHLRTTITNTSKRSATSENKEAYKIIYNWQYCHSLDFWSRVLSQQCNPEIEETKHKNKESPLRSLIYPLVQVTLGTIRLIPTPQFYPLRFYLIRSLIRLSQNTGVYIPIYPLIQEILTSSLFKKPAKSVSLPAFDFEHNIKAGQQYLGTRVYQEGVCEQFIDLTSEFFVLYCKSAAFPELITPPVIALRRFLKKSRLIKFNKQVQQLVEKLTSNAHLITSKRSKIQYGPSNKAEVRTFMKDTKWETTPLGQYVTVHRRSREEKLRLLKEAVLEEEEAKKKSKSKDVEMEDALNTSESEGEDDEDAEGSDDE
ncbi:hypothetical protein FT663_03330 [Candidozyma haemuli var. vulneris]|uniref:Nucleolar complex protein 2 n=1 Tax=Candidozyma haemuli TaxID=45357 RepID=A0A2V1AUK1_9ASCO|nr:hypothetical protein CXQ85_000469 [[Candida] haemuloni]KAF3989459.1 hypothetical protein FT662_02825 [[Candida] haemuloni var. vulneris]KAF3990085.1 hypothetical protein FT663_03330 [[Candida] haemuloni var. vulneris]PVH21489.1 hypothetical protein CXQ85_000469 [[Candida] haemuloni]